MAVTTGIFNTAQFTTDLQKKSFASMLTRLMPGGGAAPLFALTSRLKNATAVATEHGFWTKTMVFPGFTLTANVAIGDTVFTVADTSMLIPGQTHRLQQTGEIVIINSVLSDTSIQVGRAVGNVAAAAITVASQITQAYQISTAFEEGSIRPNALTVQPVKVTNLTQIVRDTWALTGTAAAVEVIAGESSVAENRQDCAAFHAVGIERLLFWGQKSQGFRKGQPFRTMDGLISMISNLAYYPPSYSVPNVYTAGATTTYDQLLAMVDPVFNQVTDPRSSNDRIMFVGGAAFNVINKIGRLSGTYQIVQDQTSFGMRYSHFKVPRGEFALIEHPLFNTNPHWSKMAVAVDPSGFALAYLNGRQTKNKEFNMDGAVTDNGIDAVGGTLTTELTLEVRNPPANAVIYNLTDAA